MNDRVLICHPKFLYFYEREGLSIWVTYEFFLEEIQNVTAIEKKKNRKKIQIEKENKSPNRIWNVNERKKMQFLRPRCKIAVKKTVVDHC